MKIFTIIAAFLILTSSAFAGQSVKVIERTPNGYEKLSVTTGDVVRITEALREAARGVFITVETNNIRFRIDGGDPAITTGHLVVASSYQSIWLNNRAAISRLRMIGIGGTATVHVTTYQE
jgi:hypothetical protein